MEKIKLKNNDGEEVEIFNSISPGRLEGESSSEYKIRREFFNALISTYRKRGVKASFGQKTKAGWKKQVSNDLLKIQQLNEKPKNNEEGS